MPSLGLRFLDSEAVVECDSDRLWEALAYLYRPALVPVSAAAPLRLQVSAAAGVRAISCGSTRQLAAPGAGETLAEELIFTEIVTRVSTHWLLHAAALAGPHGGVLIVGESGAGKTTLALALSRQGYQWLSDEVAAIDRTTGLLESFPRGCSSAHRRCACCRSCGSGLSPGRSRGRRRASAGSRRSRT